MRSQIIGNFIHENLKKIYYLNSYKLLIKIGYVRISLEANFSTFQFDVMYNLNSVLSFFPLLLLYPTYEQTLILVELLLSFLFLNLLQQKRFYSIYLFICFIFMRLCGTTIRDTGIAEF